jgi:hypothetical protein
MITPLLTGATLSTGSEEYTLHHKKAKKTVIIEGGTFDSRSRTIYKIDKNTVCIF